MANICEYCLKIKGKKEDCHLFLLSMPAYDDYNVIKEEGTDDDFILAATGTCKWDVYAYVEDVEADFDHEAVRKSISESKCTDLWYIPLKDKSKVFNVDVRISWTDIEDTVIDEEENCIMSSYEHWNNGEEAEITEEESKEEFFVFKLDDYDYGWDEDDEYDEYDDEDEDEYDEDE
jgi:hypothetical protein